MPLSYDLETKAVLRQLNQANRRLADLKEVALTIPNENILVSTLTSQEAKDSSEVENIVTTQDDRLIQAIRDKNGNNTAQWEAWILFMLKGIEDTAIETTRLVKGISKLMAEFKAILRPKFGKQYRHELLNNLFFHPYTKVEFIEKELMVSRITANRYPNTLVETGLIERVKIGRSYHYMNLPLINLFMSISDSGPSETAAPVESVSENQ